MIRKEDVTLEISVNLVYNDEDTLYAVDRSSDEYSLSNLQSSDDLALTSDRLTKRLTLSVLMLRSTYYLPTTLTASMKQTSSMALTKSKSMISPTHPLKKTHLRKHNALHQ